MTYRRLGIPIVALAATIFAASVVLAPAAGASSGSAGVNRAITPSGSTSYSPTADGDGSGLTQELGPGFAQQSDGFFSNGNHTGVNRSRSIEHNAPSVPLAPIAPGVGVSSSGLTVLNTFDALNHRQQRRANGGNQFSLEPPDQGLCANNGVVVETINDVMRVYSANGTPLQGVEDLNTFLGYHAQFNRTTGEIGQFVTDPACFFDPTVNRWFLDALTIEVFPFNDPKNHISAGDFTGQNHIDLAVSDTSSPLGTWTIYRFQVQDDGNNGTPDHGCKGIAPFGQSTIPTFPNACIGDYPHIGADANAIYIDTNEYSFFGNDFHGAQIYAFAKAALVAGTSVNVTQFDTHGMDNGNSGFTIWPATAPAGLNSTDNGGTEFFLSSNAADEAHGNGASVGPRQSNQLLVWKVTQSSTIDSATPALVLSHSTLSVGLYVVPARSEQKVGDTPLADCLSLKSCATNFALGIRDPFAPEHESPLDSNDSRMQQVVFADGKLWGALDTSVNSSANTRAGIEWFVVDPSGNGSVVNQGYLAVSQNNLTYPAIAVRPDGKGVMAFTLVGRDFYPSAAFASIDASGTGNVQIAAAGAGPSDGFSGTAVFNAPNPARPRWGDYGAAVVDGTNIFIASEYINQTCNLSEYVATGASCGGTRTLLANWGTRISEVSPG